MSRTALLISTNGSVARHWLRHHTGPRPSLIITDRDCGAASLAEEFNIPLHHITGSSNTERSDAILAALQQHAINALFLFYTRLLTGRLLTTFAAQGGHIINFHPSLLPAFPGMHGFEDTMRSGALFFGSTVHLVDSGTDTGQPLLQAAAPKNIHATDTTAMRHTVFAQQVACLAQVHAWVLQGRLAQNAEGRTFIRQAGYQTNGLINPALEDEAATLYQTILNARTT